MKHSHYKNKFWLEQKYIIEGCSLREIGQLAGVSHVTIRNWLKKYGILKIKQDDETLKEEISKDYEKAKEAVGKIKRIAKERGVPLSLLLDEEILELVKFFEDEEKFEPKEKKFVGSRVVHKSMHPSDRVEHGGGEPIGKGYYNARDSSNSFAEEMSLIEEIDC